MYEGHNHHRSMPNTGRKVHCVDGNPSICEQLTTLFELEGFEATYSLDAAHFLASLQSEIPDVVIINLEIDGESGLSLLRRLKAISAQTAAVMTTNKPRVATAVAAMKLGALDLLCAPIDKEYLLGVVRDAVDRHQPVAVPTVGTARNVQFHGLAQLTPREREVLQLITNGNSNKQTAQELGISGRTVEVHRANLMSKLGARNAADLMRIVLTH